jgi:hypothetical protein
MTYKKSAPDAENTNTPLNFNSTVIRSRLKKAFPELTECFAWLSDGYAHGATWQALVERHAKHLDPARRRALTEEAIDASNFIPDNREPHVTNFVTAVLGLDPAVLAGEDFDGSEFVDRLITELLNGKG